MKSRFLTILVTAVVTALITSALWVAGLAVVYHYFSGEPPPFAVRIEAPEEVAVGEMMEIKVEVSNPTDGKLELGSIDVYDSLLEGFSVEEVEPEATQRNHTLDFSTFYYSQSLPAGKTFTARFRLKATKAGLWTGDVDCCTPAEKFVSSSVTIRVKGGDGGGGDSGTGGAEDPKNEAPKGGDGKGGGKPRIVPEARGRAGWVRFR